MRNYKFRVLKPTEYGKFTEMIGLSNSIFLAGPCSREDFSSDWRYTAFDILDELGFTGTVITPTNAHFKEYERNGNLTHDDMRRKQVDWERRMMYACSALVFWIPRDEEHPARTTNIEFGEWYKRNNVFFGWPDNDNATQNDTIDFDDGFHLMMSSSMEYEYLKRSGKEIPEELNQRMKQWSDWVDNLSPEEYDRLIH